jgi:hypothetical protein
MDRQQLEDSMLTVRTEMQEQLVIPMMIVRILDDDVISKSK